MSFQAEWHVGIKQREAVCIMHGWWNEVHREWGEEARCEKSRRREREAEGEMSAGEKGLDCEGEKMGSSGWRWEEGGGFLEERKGRLYQRRMKPGWFGERERRDSRETRAAELCHTAPSFTSALIHPHPHLLLFSRFTCPRVCPLSPSRQSYSSLLHRCAAKPNLFVSSAA